MFASSMIELSLWQAVTSINNQIRSGGIAGGIRSKVQESTLELLRQTLTTHGNLVLPDLLSLLGDKAGDLGRDIARRNRV